MATAKTDNDPVNPRLGMSRDGVGPAVEACFTVKGVEYVGSPGMQLADFEPLGFAGVILATSNPEDVEGAALCYRDLLVGMPGSEPTYRRQKVAAVSVIETRLSRWRPHRGSPRRQSRATGWELR